MGRLGGRQAVGLEPAAGDGLWTLTAHAAALAGALCVLDSDLAQAGQTHQARVLGHAASSGLRLVAAEVFDLAAAGPLPRVQVYPRPQRPLRVGAAEDVHPGQYRLALLVRRTGVPLHTDDLGLVVRTQFRAATAAAGVLAGHDPDTAARLNRYAQALTLMPAALQQVQGLDERNPVVTAQARQVVAFVAAVAAGTGSGEPAGSARHEVAVQAALGFARAVPAVARAMSTAAQDRVRTGAWVVDVATFDTRPAGLRVGGARRQRWARHTPGAALPVLDRLSDVAASVGALASQRPTARSSPRARGFAASRARPVLQDGPPTDLRSSALGELREATRSRALPRRPPAPSQRPQALHHDVLVTPSGGHLLTGGQVELLEQVASGRPMLAVYASRRCRADTLERELVHVYTTLGSLDPQVGVGQEAARQASRALEVLAALEEVGAARGGLVQAEGAAGPTLGRAPAQHTRLQEATARLTWAQRRLDPGPHPVPAGHSRPAGQGPPAPRCPRWHEPGGDPPAAARTGTGREHRQTAISVTRTRSPREPGPAVAPGGVDPQGDGGTGAVAVVSRIPMDTYSPSIPKYPEAASWHPTRKRGSCDDSDHRTGAQPLLPRLTATVLRGS